jgi:hypothetical protein
MLRGSLLLIAGSSLLACSDPGGDAVERSGLDACAGAGCALPAPGAAGEPFTIVVLPDTQFYADTYHPIFRAQTDWILAEKDRRRIAFVLHEGDIVNVDVDEQWAVAADSLHSLDGAVPYVLSAGNHDFPYKGGRITRDCDLLNAYFPASALATAPWPTGTFASNRIENHYQVLPAGGRQYLVLSLEFGPRDAVVDWANVVLGQYPTLPAIIVTHAYLSRDSKRFERQPFHPCGPGGNEFSDCNDGQMLWDKLISRHDNVVFVFSGHDLFPGVARTISRQASGKQVHELLANYQTCGGLPCTVPDTGQPTAGGDGFLRIVTIDPTTRSAAVETFSPYLAAAGREPYKRDPHNQFTLPLDAWQFQAPPPRAVAAALPGPEPRESGGSRLAVREPLGSAGGEAKPAPPLAPAAEAWRACDGIQVVLGGLDAAGDPWSAHRLQACIDGACEGFAIEPRTLACVPDRRQQDVTCLNDEGMLRLFFFGARGSRPLVTVTAEDARGEALFRGRSVVTARPEGDGCWTALHTLHPMRLPARRFAGVAAPAAQPR